MTSIQENLQNIQISLNNINDILKKQCGNNEPKPPPPPSNETIPIKPQLSIQEVQKVLEDCLDTLGREVIENVIKSNGSESGRLTHLDISKYRNVVEEVQALCQNTPD